MGETKKIVVDHFPVDRLPEELRHGLESGRMVRVTVEENGEERREPLTSLQGAGKGCYSADEAITYIHQLRDE